MSKEALEALAQTTTAGLPNAPKIIIADSARAIWGSKVPTGTTPAGAVVDGNIYLFRDGIENPMGALRTIFHELFHTGLKNLVSKNQYIDRMLKLQAAVAAPPGV